MYYPITILLEKVIIQVNKKKKQEKQSGQALIEFVLLLAVIMSLSFLFLRGFNSAIGKRWLIIIEIISDASGLILD